MPLRHSATRAAFAENVRTLMHEGYPQKRAVAIAYAEQRRVRANVTLRLASPGKSVARILSDHARLDAALAKRPVRF